MLRSTMHHQGAVGNNSQPEIIVNYSHKKGGHHLTRGVLHVLHLIELNGGHIARFRRRKR